MARNWRVLSWPKGQEAGNKKDHGTFENKEEAEKFIRAAKVEHPDREYEAVEWPAA